MTTPQDKTAEALRLADVIEREGLPIDDDRNDAAVAMLREYASLLQAQPAEAERIQRLEAENEALRRVVGTARAVADGAEDLGEDFLVPSHLMAPLSLALDELDAMTKEQEGMTNITPEQREQFAIEQWLTKITAADLIDQLYEAEDFFQAAVERGDCELIGKVVLAVRHAYAHRLAALHLYDEPVKLPNARQAAALAVIQHEGGKA